MARYVVKRILLAFVTILVATSITFFTMHAVPGGPFSKEKAPMPAVQAVLESRFHLNEPVGVQYLLYMQDMAHGNFGVSLKTGREISLTLSETFGVSARLGISSILVAVTMGILLGVTAALNRNKLPDRIIIFFTTFFVSVPSFVLATILLLVFCLQLKVLPVWSAQSPNYILPVISLAFYPMAYITRLTKSSMLDVMGEDYIRTARAKGLLKPAILFKHALRNAVLPVITYLGPLVAYTLTGSMVIESIFTMGGMGREFVQSIINRDYSMIMACTMFLATLMVICTLICDIIYKWVDPRIDFD